jgi:hypothetical protein
MFQRLTFEAPLPNARNQKSLARTRYLAIFIENTPGWVLARRGLFLYWRKCCVSMPLLARRILKWDMGT